MFHFLIVLYGLSLTEAHNIKISGKLEFGKELSKIFKEVYYGWTEQRNEPQTGSQGIKEDVDTDKIPKEHKNHLLNNNENAENLPVLDKMVQNEQENVHLYGNHKLKKEVNDGGPLNNVHLRSKIEE